MHKSAPSRNKWKFSGRGVFVTAYSSVKKVPEGFSNLIVFRTRSKILHRPQFVEMKIRNGLGLGVDSPKRGPRHNFSSVCLPNVTSKSSPTTHIFTVVQGPSPTVGLIIPWVQV